MFSSLFQTQVVLMSKMVLEEQRYFMQYTSTRMKCWIIY